MQTSNDWKIVFMGTPEFGVPSLRALCEHGYDVTAVVTQPDRPRGRGHKLIPSPVKECALELGLPIFQPDRISSPEGLDWMRAQKPDLIITAAFGQILSEELLDIPPLGCINVHASLLPKYRGASPIVWSIINGEKEAGVTTMYTVKALDAGPILEQDSMEIPDGMTGGQLTQALSVLGAKTLLRTLRALEADTLEPREQDEAEATYYTQLDRSFAHIDWNKSSRELVRFIRALAPEPGAYFLLPNGERVHVYEAEEADFESPGAVGQILAADPQTGLLIQSGDGVLSLKVIKRANSKMMSATDSLRGRTIDLGQVH